MPREGGIGIDSTERHLLEISGIVEAAEVAGGHRISVLDGAGIEASGAGDIAKPFGFLAAGKQFGCAAA
jgi:hypothetical protein